MSHKFLSSQKWGHSVLAIITAFTLTIGLSTPFSTANAAPFNPHNIITDTEIRQANAMSATEIKAFLNSKGNLDNYFDTDPNDGLLKSVSQLVTDASQRYGINPKYILVLIQKESSLVESKSPSQKLLDWATGYGLCDGCYRSNPLAQKYKGLAKQIDAGAGWMDWFFKNNASISYLYKPGNTYKISKTSVTPNNLATAGLYSYTPHISGNQLFFAIWQRWFGDTTQDTTLSRMPDGAVLKNIKTNEYSIIQGGSFRPVKYTSLIGTRFSSTGIIMLSDVDYTSLTKTNPGRPITFADLSLVRVENGDIYLLVGNTRRHIVSQEVFSKIGFNPEEVEEALFSDIAEYIPGPDITLTNTNVETRLIQDTDDGSIYYIEGNIKHPLWDKALLTVNFPSKTISQASHEELDKYITADPVRFLDGTLVKSSNDPTVYLISSGKKRAISDEKTFLDLGFNWQSIITTNSKMLNLHETGTPVIFRIDETEQPIQTASL